MGSLGSYALTDDQKEYQDPAGYIAIFLGFPSYCLKMSLNLLICAARIPGGGGS